MRIEEVLDSVMKHVDDLDAAKLVETLVEQVIPSSPHVLMLVGGADRRRELREALSAEGYRSTAVEEAERFPLSMERLRPDVVLLEAEGCRGRLPHYLGLSRAIQPNVLSLVLADMKDKDGVIAAYGAGADLVLDRPMPIADVLARVGQRLDAMRQRFRHELAQARFERHIGQKLTRFLQHVKLLRDRAIALGGAYHEVVDRLRRASQWRDDETGDHIRRIGLFSRKVAEKMGLSQRDIDLLGEAAPLHDLGKIGVPDKILLKPGKLDPVEFEWMKTHTVIGAEILSGSHDPLLRAGEAIALNHHEWFNGRGYPNGRKREKIPLFAKIVAVVDVYDAMIHQRIYKEAISMDQSIDTMRKRRETQFDPAVFDAFLDSVEDLMKIEQQMSDGTATQSSKYNIQFGIHSMTRFLDETLKKV